MEHPSRSGQITLLVEIKIHEGKTEEFKAAVAELVSSVRTNEPGALRYDFYVSADGRHDWNVEVFADSDAVVAHMENVGPLLPKLLDSATFLRIEVLGALSEAGYEALGELAKGKLLLRGLEDPR